MKLRCVSDGTPGGTRLLTEDNQVIDNVTCIELIITPRGMKVTLEFAIMQVEVSFDAPMPQHGSPGAALLSRQ